MEVTELTKEIYEKYPDVWEMLETKYMPAFEELDYITSNDNYNITNEEKIIFNIFFGILEDFFEENEIIIQIEKSYIIKTEKYNLIGYIDFNYFDGWNYEILSQGKNKICKCNLDSKNEAKTKAILKSCEILNNKLKDK